MLCIFLYFIHKLSRNINNKIFKFFFSTKKNINILKYFEFAVYETVKSSFIAFSNKNIF